MNKENKYRDEAGETNQIRDNSLVAGSKYHRPTLTTLRHFCET